MRAFDMKSLFVAMDQRRRELGLSWDELARQVNLPFRHSTSIPINPATLRSISKKRSTTSAVVLQVLRWMGRTPEDFLVGASGAGALGAELPRSGDDRILRFDTRAMYDAINDQRAKRGLTWKEVAAELPGFTPSMLTNLAQGPLIGFPRVMFITQWLGRPAADFVLGRLE